MWPSRNNQLACSGNRRSISSEMRMFGILRYVLLLSRTDVIALDAVLRPGGGCLGEVGWREETVSVPGLASTLRGRPAGWLVLQACTPWDFPSCPLPSFPPSIPLPCPGFSSGTCTGRRWFPMCVADIPCRGLSAVLCKKAAMGDHSPAPACSGYSVK